MLIFCTYEKKSLTYEKEMSQLRAVTSSGQGEVHLMLLIWQKTNNSCFLLHTLQCYVVPEIPTIRNLLQQSETFHFLKSL